MWLHRKCQVFNICSFTLISCACCLCHSFNEGERERNTIVSQWSLFEHRPLISNNLKVLKSFSLASLYLNNIFNNLTTFFSDLLLNLFKFIMTTQVNYHTRNSSSSSIKRLKTTAKYNIRKELKGTYRHE